jgi:hypothetical protein
MNPNASMTLEKGRARLPVLRSLGEGGCRAVTFSEEIQFRLDGVALPLMTGSITMNPRFPFIIYNLSFIIYWGGVLCD